MNKPYGYKEKDLIALADFVENGGFYGKPLSRGFKEYALISGKAAGSVRNLYYSLAKFSRENADFSDKHLNGKPIFVQKSEKFSEEEKSIISKIAEFSARGVSVRHATICLAGGDAKKALRYQNKYRNAVKRSVARENDDSALQIVSAEKFLSARLKAEINRLADRLVSDYKKENARLYRQVAALKSENERLIKRLGEKNGGIIGYLKRNAGAPDVKYLNH